MTGGVTMAGKKCPHCRTKERSEEEIKDLITRLNRIEGQISYGMTDTMGRMHSDAQFAGSSSVPAHVEMMGLIGAGNNPMVGMTVSTAVSVEEAAKAAKF